MKNKYEGGQLFGGEWTESKLEVIRKYLIQYQRALKNQPFRLWYVDAFAGTGKRASQRTSQLSYTLLSALEGDLDQSQSDGHRDGSATIALSLDRPFQHYLFIEKYRSKCVQLESMIKERFSALSIRCMVERGDANTAKNKWCRERDWSKERAVVFLDPFGLQVKWSTIQALGATKGVDLWYLFPLSVLRLLKRDGVIVPAWQSRLTLLFGTSEWDSRFYDRSVPTLIEGLNGTTRKANVDSVQQFVKERLRTCFASVADGKVILNSNGSPMFLLCFAAANAKGAPIAIRIAQHILDN